MSLQAVTWNIAAVNNNPWEYWITHDDEKYTTLMADVQAFIDDPGSNDVKVSTVFTDSMFDELKQAMLGHGWSGICETEEVWNDDYKNRKIISGFLKDKVLGDKRLASMPDRFTNTINTADGSILCRPTLINCYEGPLDSVDEWWTHWRTFMFDTSVSIKSKKGVETKKPCEMLQLIKNAKYPAISVEEEKISIPLQTLCQAIFDAVLVHMLNTVAPGSWHTIKLQMMEALNKNKAALILEILQSPSYISSDIIFLQEAAGAFVEKAGSTSLATNFHILSPEALDRERDQNSIILLRKDRFAVDSFQEVTAQVMAAIEAAVPLAAGDLFVVTAQDSSGQAFVVASFHGDTNGLATIPVVSALHSFAASLPDHQLLLGLDANTHTTGDAKRQGVTEFAEDYVAKGLSSCWGDTPDPSKHTTFCARTYLQPQLNKAVSLQERSTSKLTDKNPKDFILFNRSQYCVANVVKDNTGSGAVDPFDPEIPFPTLHFPSDHALVATRLQRLASADTPSGKCPWPFVLMHDPKGGLLDHPLKTAVLALGLATYVAWRV